MYPSAGGESKTLRVSDALFGEGYIAVCAGEGRLLRAPLQEQRKHIANAKWEFEDTKRIFHACLPPHHLLIGPVLHEIPDHITTRISLWSLLGSMVLAISVKSIQTRHTECGVYYKMADLLRVVKDNG